jgi:hypothetical protein
MQKCDATKPVRNQWGGKSEASLPRHSQRCSGNKESSAAHLLWSPQPARSFAPGGCWGRPGGLCLGQKRRLREDSGAGCLSVVEESWSWPASVGLRWRAVWPQGPRAPGFVSRRPASWRRGQHELWLGLRGIQERKLYFSWRFLSRLSRSPSSLKRLSSSVMKFFATVLRAGSEYAR